MGFTRIFLLLVYLSIFSIFSTAVAESFVHPDCLNDTICLKPGSDEEVLIDQRISEMDYEIYEIGDDENCRATETIIKPFSIKFEGRWHKIHQTKYFEQTLKQVKCKNVGESCFDKIMMSSSNEANYSYKGCVEIESTIILRYIDPETNDLKDHDFKLSVGCGCRIIDKL